MNKQEFKKEIEALSIPISDTQLEQFEEYARLLKEWNEKMNLTAITEDSEIWEKHFYDSIRPFEKAEFKTLCDVGSGAGFPGIPLAILFPDRTFTLVEPLGKRCKFLEEVKKQLNLDNVRIENARAEDYAQDHREEFDAVSARAVARLSILLELCVPLLKKGGTFIALKGRNGMEELTQAAPALRELKVSLDHTDAFELEHESGRIVFFFTKNAKTPAKYPRNYGMIKKKPMEEVQ
ncbi:16S rRNA (guanine(527)-N(7))-methyltransferase RsmG [Ileibacterium valens]|uniref:16S rRNA (guanine(527)-N(7))-methyltransferase RsmG n=1 Tax=Ileibacterium valens TaxID=1862668 RepID=UPI00235558C6|nr:16S rRNA (guanine(527)-N(7))-methyltransferase RsmG [Ileibacterium valens]